MNLACVISPFSKRTAAPNRKSIVPCSTSSVIGVNLLWSEHEISTWPGKHGKPFIHVLEHFMQGLCALVPIQSIVMRIPSRSESNARSSAKIKTDPPPAKATEMPTRLTARGPNSNWCNGTRIKRDQPPLASRAPPTRLLRC